MSADVREESGRAGFRRHGFGRDARARARTAASRARRSASTTGSAMSSELAAAGRVAKMLGAIEHKTVHVDLRSIGGSALTADIDVPKRRRRRHSGHVCAGAQHDHALGRARLGRSARRARHLLRRQCGRLFGLSGLPSRNSSRRSRRSPISRPRPASKAARIRVHAPLIRLSKADIVREGVRLGVDFAATVSCYQADARWPRVRRVRRLPPSRAEALPRPASPIRRAIAMRKPRS